MNALKAWNEACQRCLRVCKGMRGGSSVPVCTGCKVR